MHATVAVMELLPETPLGRRGSPQSMQSIVALYDRHVPTIAEALAELGGMPISLIHTELIALLPPKHEVEENTRSQLLRAAGDLQTTPRIPLASGVVELRKPASSERSFTVASGPVIRTTQSDHTVAETSSVPEGTPEYYPELSTDEAGPYHDKPRCPHWDGSVVDAALCAVTFELDDTATRRAESVIELTREFDGDVWALSVRDGEVIILALFELSARRGHGTAELGEDRAADFALLVRERYGEELRCAVALGHCLRGTLSAPGWDLPAVAGAPITVVTDLLQYGAPGQTLMDGANRGGKRIPAGTTLLLWRESRVSTNESFLGREPELKQIRTYVASEARETLQVIGPPGIGKSALVEQIVRSRPPSAVLQVVGSDSVEAPFAAVTNALGAYWHLPTWDAPNHREHLAERLSSARRRIRDEELIAEYDRLPHFMEHALGEESTIAVALDPETRYNGIHSALTVLLAAFQEVRVLWIDDQQWVDKGSISVLASWVGTRGSARLRVLSTVRTNPETAGHTPEAGVSGLGRPIRELKLSGLPEPVARALLKQRGTTDLIPGPDVEAIIDRCGGNPFFLDQSVRFVEAQIAKGSPLSIPESIHSVILARIEQLSTEAREAVNMAAVLGLRFDMRILSAMLREEKLPGALESAQRESLWEALGELNFIFCHALIRDTVYDAQFEERRIELHAAAVRAFEQIYTGDSRRAHLYQLAEHCERAGQTAHAITYLAEAADYAFHQYQNDHAVALLRRRLALAGPSDLRAIADLADALRRTVAWEEAARLLAAVLAEGGAGPGCSEHRHAGAGKHGLQARPRNATPQSWTGPLPTGAV